MANKNTSKSCVLVILLWIEDSRRPSNVQSTFVLIEIASTSIRQMSTWDRTHVKSYEPQTSSVYGSHWFSVRALYFFYRSKHGLVQSRMVGLAWFHVRAPGTTLLEWGTKTDPLASTGHFMWRSWHREFSAVLETTNIYVSILVQCIHVLLNTDAED